MRLFVCLFLLAALTLPAPGYSFDLSPDDKQYAYTYDLLPSSDFKSFSSALNILFPVPDKEVAFSLEYLSFGSAVLTGNSYSFTYRVLWGLDQWKFIKPVALFGWRIIYTDETDMVAPLDFGIIPEIHLAGNTYLQIPLVVSLFSKDNILDFSFDIQQKGAFFGDLVLGMRKIAPLKGSSFIEKTLFLLGIRNQF